MRSPREKFLRSSFRCFVSLAFILGIPTVLGFASAIKSYDGFCYGFTDGKWPCTLGELAVSEISFLTIFTCLLTPIPFIFWGRAVGRVVASSMKLGRAIAFFLTFTLAIAGGIFGYFFSALFLVFTGAVVKILGI